MTFGFISSIMLLVVAVISTPIVNGIETCKVTGGAVGPVDLNVLASRGNTPTGDYTIRSQQFDRSEYVFNVCDKLNYVDEVCVVGATMCDRSVSTEKAVSIWGNLSTIKVDYQPFRGSADQVLTMEFDSRTPCYYKPKQVTVAKIYFVCNAAATEPKLSINYEDYLECAVEINFQTAAACGDSAPTKYTCSSGYACVESTNGTLDFDGCEQKCIDPNPKTTTPAAGTKYHCVNDKCEPVTGGEAGVDKEVCESVCENTAVKYHCVDDKCVETTGTEAGVDKEVCQSVCETQSTTTPKVIKYHCVDDKCVETTGTEAGVDKEVCESVCEIQSTTTPKVVKYHCVDDKCVETVGGEAGVDKEVCESVCETTATKYHCVSEKCEAVGAGQPGVDKELCESACESDNTEYHCVNEKCEPVAPGDSGVPLATCQAVCSAEVFPVKSENHGGFRCYNGKIMAVSFGGFSYEQIAAVCSPTSTL